jgi:hypothetical protein
MDIALIAALTLLASTVGTVTGFGTSTIMVPVLAAFLPLPQVLLLVGIIHWFGDIWKMLLFRGGVRWRLILLFGGTGIVATVIGGLLVFQAPESLLSRALGGFLLLYVIFLLAKQRFRIPQTTPTAVLGGVLHGFAAGIFGVGGAVHATIRPNRNLKITQAEYPGGIQLWASNPAFVWTADREEEEGLHVHTYDAAGQLRLDDTYGEVIVDGVLLDEIQIQHFMAQGALPYLKDRVLTLRCPTCRNAHFDRGEFGFLPHAEHLCESCGASFGSPGKLRMVVSNPFVEVREQMLRNRPNVIAAEGHTQ